MFFSGFFSLLFLSIEKISVLNEILWKFQKASVSLGANPDEWFKHKTNLIPAFELLIITRSAAHATTAVVHSASPDVCYPSFCMQIKLLSLRLFHLVLPWLWTSTTNLTSGINSVEDSSFYTRNESGFLHEGRFCHYLL